MLICIHRMSHTEAGIPIALFLAFSSSACFCCLYFDPLIPWAPSSLCLSHRTTDDMAMFYCFWTETRNSPKNRANLNVFMKYSLIICSTNISWKNLDISNSFIQWWVQTNTYCSCWIIWLLLNNWVICQGEHIFLDVKDRHGIICYSETNMCWMLCCSIC